MCKVLSAWHMVNINSVEVLLPSQIHVTKHLPDVRVPEEFSV